VFNQYTTAHTTELPSLNTYSNFGSPTRSVTFCNFSKKEEEELQEEWFITADICLCMTNKMDTDVSHAKDLAERRFRTLFFVMRLGGVPCNMKNVSIVHAIYNVVTVVCYCVTYFFIVMEFTVTTQSLEETMNNFRAAYAFGLVSWTYLSVRYVRSQSILMRTFLQNLFSCVIMQQG
jgi:hypothetical protein